MTDQKRNRVFREDIGHAEPGLYWEWYCGHRIIVYRPNTILKAGIVTWADKTLEILRDWPEDAPYLAVHDLSNSKMAMAYVTTVKYDIFNVGILEKNRTAINALFEARPHFRAHVGLVFSLSHSGYLLHTLTRYYKPSHERIRFEGFFKCVRALDWLFTEISGRP